MNRTLLLLLLALVTAAPAFAAGRPAAPNLVFILADDLGWSDTTLNGTTRLYETPNLERLAKRGMTFAQAYSANPLCSPTRASIQTGLYPGRIGITAPACHLPEERFAAALSSRAAPDHPALAQVSATRLKHEYFTLAESLRAAGYRTAHFGKWHLGREPYDPLHQGFEVDIPHVPEAAGPGGGYLAPWKFIRNTNFVGAPGDHIEDRLSQEAARFIRQHQDQPFYVNYWAYSVHSPWSAKPDLVERYQSRIDPQSPQRNPLYAAMVRSLDEAVGRILDAIDQAGVADRTVIVFFSDNGGWCWNPRETSPPGYEEIPATSNTPLRGGKATLYEGGTREPCVVVWPGRVKAGSRSNAFLSSVDFYPTLLEVLGISAQPGQRFDGVSQVPALLGQGAPRDTLYCFFPHYTPATGNRPGTWVRRGGWKLIRFHCDNEDQSDRFELYHLEQDLGETNNLAAKFPDRVRELNGLIDQHLGEIEALVPTRNPAYRPGAAPRNTPPRAAATPRTSGAPVAGWTPSQDCRLSLGDGTLLIQATGGDPFLSIRFDPVPVAGEVVLEVRLRSTAQGGGQVFWSEQDVSPPFLRDRSVPFTPQHSGAWETHRVTLKPARPLTAIRLDPATRAGEIALDSLRLLEGSGRVLRQWEFGGPARP